MLLQIVLNFKLTLSKILHTLHYLSHDEVSDRDAISKFKRGSIR